MRTTTGDEDDPTTDVEPVHDEPIRNLPTARRPRPLTPAEHADLVRKDRIRTLGEDLYELATVTDLRDSERLGHLLPLEALISGWLTACRSQDTRQAYRIDITIYLNWCATQTPPINPIQAGWFDVEMYVRWLTTEARPVEQWAGATYSRGTHARRISSLKSFYGYCHDRDEILRNPTRTLKTPKIEQPRRRVLSPAHQAALLAAADVHEWTRGGRQRQLTWVALIAVALDHGWRESEYRRATIGNLTTVTAADGNAYAAVRRHTKGDKHKTEILTTRARDAIEAMLGGRGIGDVWTIDARPATATDVPRSTPLFTFKPGRPPGESSLACGLEALAVAAGLDPGRDKIHRVDRVTWHMLRRTSATTDLDAGAPIDAVADKLGHASVDTTRAHYDQHRHNPERSPAYRRGLIAPLTQEPPT